MHTPIRPPIHPPTYASPCPFLRPPRLHEEEAVKLRDRVEVLAARLAEAEAEGRKLRDTKYELDSKVHVGGGAERQCARCGRGWGGWVGGWEAAAG